MKLLKLLIVASVIGVIGACAPLTSERLADAQAMKPSGNAFQTALWKGYIGLADTELKEMDLSASEMFIDKAVMAGKGQSPAPTDPNGYKDSIPADKLGMLSAGYARLTKGLADNGTQKAPDKAAEAQIAYECWLHEQSEGVEPLEIEGCRAKFMAAMDAVEAALKPAAAAPAPAPAPAKMPGPYTIYFAWNKYNLDKPAMTVINQVVADAKTGKPSVINVTGHTDTSGSPAYNLKLSQKRADAVARALKKAGATAIVATFWVGEDDLAVPTGPNVREAKNRRTVIVLGK
ncbi:MAG: OmpA family protein [Alphaproteobacteria bacterium]